MRTQKKSLTARNILIVDDESVVADVLQRILTKIGYTTMTDDSERSAIALFRKETFDLILLDIVMPGKNGFEIAKEIKRIDPRQKIVMMTGMSLEDEKMKTVAETVKIDNFLPKPFSWEQIRDVVTSTIQVENN